MREITITQNDADQRLDRFLKKYLAKAPLSAIYKIVRKDVKVNGKRQKEDYMLRPGDVLSLYLADQDIEAYSQKTRPHTAKRQFTVCYEDDNLIIVSKPYGLLVHGDKTEKKDTLANQVVDYLIETGAYSPRAERSFVPSPVHRLDRNTTGLVIFGKNAEALRVLSAMLKKEPDCSEESQNGSAGRALRKIYLTIVEGRLEKELHLKNKLLKDEQRNRGKVLPLSTAEGKYIETIARPVYSNGRYTLTEVELVTGRSHQIRAHLSRAGHPLLGDTKYGGHSAADRTTQLLHAWKIEFTDAPEPLAYLNGKTVEAPLPFDWKITQTRLLGKEIY